MFFKGPYFFLSNFYPASLRFKLSSGKWVYAPTAEHAYQASKTALAYEQAYILSLPTPLAAKRAAKKITIIPKWDELKVVSMKGIIKAKFYHGRDISIKLMQLEEPIIEHNRWHDTYWGVCNGKGDNVLGKILEERRYEFKRDNCHV